MQIILLVEDNKDYRANLAELLQLEMYHTLEAENGRIGLAMIGDHLPDLILCDIDMPIMTGVEMLVLMKQDSRISGIPIIFITGHTDELTRKQVMGLGANLCLAKTVSIDDLIKFIYELLNTTTVQ
jgi:CheY-like chemotaxis protein